MKMGETTSKKYGFKIKQMQLGHWVVTIQFVKLFLFLCAIKVIEKVVLNNNNNNKNHKKGRRWLSRKSSAEEGQKCAASSKKAAWSEKKRNWISYL